MPNTMQALHTRPLNENLITKSLTAADYVATLDAMLSRTLERISLKKEQGLRTPDELWIVDHNDVYTLGQAGKEEHILQRTNTPIIKTDRGGQVTWHGHGQLVMYWLFDLDSISWSVRNMVSHAEQAIEDVVNNCLKSTASTDTNRISARARRDAPGVYIYADMTTETDSAHTSDEIEGDNTIMIGKIASLGFKIKHGFSYHGIAINLDCDLSAFNAINPCGYAGMQMLRLADFVNMNQATNTQPTTLPLTDDKKTLTYEQFTQQLIENIAKRHARQIPLRELAPK
ncbi:octanoyltransferase [Psychrobacter sp. G]|uniref:lipoyl(octanoyl) transferase LipB n=1 Tax=Psychrobacter sp. G TaxID=571800 RepID=UPI000354D808|nr:lipoyl(octanoyl) transferase LipB [Psychrobacter sp. G]AGP48659.1 octanoyltransferase [Psychrobacter sp. G]